VPSSGWIYLVLYALVFFIGNIFFTTAIYKLDASTFSPFMQLQSAFIAIFAYIFLGERFSSISYLFIFLMIIGAILVSFDEKMSLKSFFKIAILLIVFQQIFHALSNLFAGFALKDMNSFTFIFWGDLMAICLIVFVIPFIGFSKLKISFSQVKPLLLSGFFSTVGATSLFTAFMTNLTVSSVLSLLTS
jgi:drug/metabolite transporter (DMT)-like permease